MRTRENGASNRPSALLGLCRCRPLLALADGLAGRAGKATIAFAGVMLVVGMLLRGLDPELCHTDLGDGLNLVGGYSYDSIAERGRS